MKACTRNCPDKISNRRKQRYPKSLVEKIKQARHINYPKPCQWGKEKESKATEEYLKNRTNGECIRVCENCGFIVNKKYPWLGASPDFFWLLTALKRRLLHWGN